MDDKDLNKAIFGCVFMLCALVYVVFGELS